MKLASAGNSNTLPSTLVSISAAGSTFALGVTTVHCTATDASGNAANGSFDVPARRDARALHGNGHARKRHDGADAATAPGGRRRCHHPVRSDGHLPGSALAARIKTIRPATATGNKAAACRDLRGFEHAARAKSAAPLRAQARRIAAILGC